VTATRDRRSDPEENAEPAWDERSILGKSRGLPWWGAVLLAFGLAAIAAAFDMQRQDTLGKIYQGAYLLGCVAAICLVRRRSLFGPMVQPPLVFAVTAVAAVVVLAPATGGGGGLKSLIFSVALPLTSNFPTMAITTGITAAIGVFRLWRERDPAADARPKREPKAPRERPSKDRMPPQRGRRSDPDALDLDDARPERRAEPGRRGESSGPRRDREAGRGGADRTRRGGPTEGRRGRGEPDAGGRGKPDRGGRSRADADPDSPPEGRRGFRGRDARPDQSAARESRGSDRAGRGRTRDADPPARRRGDAGAERPRREDRAAPSRRDTGERATPARQPRRSPQDPYR
jgi:hypothetical protein